MCDTDEVVADHGYVGLEAVPDRPEVLQAVWNVTARAVTPTTGVRCSVGPVTAEAVIEVINSEADLYADIDKLMFKRKRYRVRLEQAHKKLRLLAPLAFILEATPVDITVPRGFRLVGSPQLVPKPNLRIAMADVGIKAVKKEATGKLVAKVGDHVAEVQLEAITDQSPGLSIKIENVDHGDQRYSWRGNVLEIATKHPALSRYLGPPPEFPGQDEKHFRVIVAEIVAEAVCQRAVGHEVQKNEEDFLDADWDDYYAQYTQFMTMFLPTAHKVQCPDTK